MTKSNEIRCFCARQPLLAVYGRDKKTSELYIHLKVYKQSRIFAEVYISADAETRIRCRECLRWHKIKILQGVPVLREERDAMELIAPQTQRAHVAGPDTDRVR